MPETNRTIRFKEWGLHVDTTKRPTSEYLDSSDGTLQDVDFRLRTDSIGFISTGNELVRPGAMRKIVMLGGSFVESLFVPETDRFASVLERDLVESGRKYQVWNGGYSGSTLLHSFNVFMNKVAPLVPYIERVLIFTAMSDQRTLVHKDSYWIKDKTHAPIIENRNGHVQEDREPTSVDQARLLTAFIASVRSLGQEPVVVASPFRAAPFNEDEFTRRLHGDEATYNRSLARLRLINETARTVASEADAQLLDADEALGGRAEYFYDSMHLNVSGQYVMGRFLAHELGPQLP